MTDLNALAERLEEEAYGHGDGDYVTITGKQARQAAQALRGMGEAGELLRDLTSASAFVFNKLSSGAYATRGELYNRLRKPVDAAQAFLDRSALKGGGDGE